MANQKLIYGKQDLWEKLEEITIYLSENGLYGNISNSKAVNYLICKFYMEMKGNEKKQCIEASAN